MQQSMTPLHPEGSARSESDSSDDVIKTGPGMLCLRTVDLGGSEAWQPHYRQCIIPSNMGKGQVV